MKTSKTQQDQTRRHILAAAVDLMCRHGFDGSTMKDIAKQAGIGDATIYKYFPSKEKLILGYIDQVVADAVADTLQTPDLSSYTLQEKLQRLIDAVLERLLPEREFAQMARGIAARVPLLLSEQWPARQTLRDTVQDFLAAAEASWEIEPCGYKSAAASLFADYLWGIVLYWLADESEEFADTTQLVDLSLGLLVMLLHTGLVNRVLDLGAFALRSQFARVMQHGGGLLNLLQLAKRGMGQRASAAPPEPAPPPKTRKAPARTTAGAKPATRKAKPCAAPRCPARA